jgi:quinol monooxygenase YgiN
MYAILVTIHIKPEFRDAYLESMLDDARGSVNDEPGCFRFDVLQDENNPNTIYLYEVYRDKEAFDAHLVAPHFIRWRDTVKDWNDGPAQAVRVAPLYPAPSDWKK